MAERNAGEPVDADVNTARCFLAPRNIEVAPSRSATADEDGVVAFADETLEAVDAPLGDKLTASGQRVADLFVDDLIRQAELWNLAAHHAAGARVGIEHDDIVADCGEIACDGQRRGACADTGHALAVSLRWRAGQERCDVLLVIGRDALEPANCDRLFLEP